MLKIFTENYEPGVIEQLDRLFSVPVFKDCEIRMMPDVHVGAGCCIGFTADLGDYVIPNVVGVEIGCSVSVSKIKERELDLPKLDNIIRKHIPFGRGNKDWNYSVCHGGGRVMSRAQAFKELKLEDYKKSMEGIYTTTVTAETIDEAPMVYKPAEEIKEKIKDSVNILESIKPVYNFKASE